MFLAPDALNLRSRAMSLIENERTKLTANLFNTLAAALVAAGLFAPGAAAAYGISDLRVGSVYVTLLVLVCILGAAILHWVARGHLGRLRE
jgi:protein-S-isoprenylcysteine O-methyltransferase Ste14